MRTKPYQLYSKCVILFAGNLIAFLAVTKIPLPFETLAEMTSQSEYKYGVEDGIIQMMLFQVRQVRLILTSVHAA